MKKYPIEISILFISMLLLTGFKKNPEQPFPNSGKQSGTNNFAAIFTEPVKVSIAGTSVIKSDRGQRPVKVMVYLSKAATEPVTVKYNTVNGTAKAGVDYVAVNGSVTFEPGQVTKWITVQVIGEVAADPDEDAPAYAGANFIIRIVQAAGLIIAMSDAIISILPNIPAGTVGNQAVYEVIISYTGYATFTDSALRCGIRKNGIVVLSGLLSGIERVGRGDDIIYTGTLEMTMDIDVCSATDGDVNVDEYRLCGMTVTGTGKVNTELVIFYGADSLGTSFDGIGGYIKIENKDGRFIKTVTGSCGGQQMDEELPMVPNKSIASVFNGKELPMLTNRTLRQGVFTDTDEAGNVTVVEVLRKLR